VPGHFSGVVASKQTQPLMQEDCAVSETHEYSTDRSVILAYLENYIASLTEAHQNMVDYCWHWLGLGASSGPGVGHSTALKEHHGRTSQLDGDKSE
jgi:hypothetical protein